MQRFARRSTCVPDAVLEQRDKTVKDQVHIRNAEAAQLARSLARQTGKTINEIVLDALRQYRPPAPSKAPRKEVQAWRRLLRADRDRGIAQPDTPIEALYDESTGLAS